MSRANLDLFEADLSASLSNLQRILNFYLLKNLASNELFLLILFFYSFYYTKFFIHLLFYFSINFNSDDNKLSFS
ncbi:riboflavin synthase subunit alpha [Fusobacterium pseudoperiodonticum]|uniref:Riboflavin synthase subunit alpha n=1 Tax=Fusobacterium pseudoperiodonticum TaxID=2663009 RepID=A0A2G9EFI6_9FUSO|nr:riboflavin synthase subunit alpha [Fusobacterium pseudoperiodonticum]